MKSHKMDNEVGVLLIKQLCNKKKLVQMSYRRMPLIVIFAAIAGCAGFQPKIGMTLDEWKSECRTKNWSNGTLVRAEDGVEVYYCDNVNIFHYFKDGKLVRIDQGKLPKQEIDLKVNQ